ncbi:unnamed protein product, partial [Didymodactylos carnosus]
MRTTRKRQKKPKQIINSSPVVKKSRRTRAKVYTITPVSNTHNIRQTEGLTLKAYVGDGSILLVYNLDSTLTRNLAGFAIQCTPSSGQPYIIQNRINFRTNYTSHTTAVQRVWTPSTIAPIQKFSWLDILKSIDPVSYSYQVTALYFVDENTSDVKPGAKAVVTVQKNSLSFENLKIGFTRGYLSSQAYSENFHNAPIQPSGPKTVGYDTTPYEKQYEWLGYHARELIFNFLDECIADKSITVDVFAFDLDEPDIIRRFVKLGSRLRLFLDNASLHVGPHAIEPQVQALIKKSAGSNNVQSGHFKRFAHNKVIIQKQNDKPIKVLTGSTNFSIRGLYVQSNN